MREEITNIRWVEWASRLQAIAQNGLLYSTNPFDTQRYEAIRDIAAEMMANGSDAAFEAVRGLFSAQSGYATPKVDVRGVVFQDESILLVRERVDGLWTLPGGWADVGDLPAQAVEREVFEESGYQVRAVKLLAVYDVRRHDHPPRPFHSYKLFFRCELIGGTPAVSDETDEVGFFREDDLPPLSLGRVTPSEIARFFEYYRHPDWPTDFD